MKIKNQYGVTDAWSPEENGLLKERYNDLSTKELMEIFPNRSYEAILTRGKLLHLKKSAETIVSERLERFL